MIKYVVVIDGDHEIHWAISHALSAKEAAQDVADQYELDPDVRLMVFEFTAANIFDITHIDIRTSRMLKEVLDV